MTTSTDSRTRRRWSPTEKAKLVRRHLRDGIPVATLADDSGAAPSQIHAWIRAVLNDADQVLADKRRRDERRAQQALSAKEERIRHLEEVTAELSMEVLQLKKGRGAT